MIFTFSASPYKTFIVTDNYNFFCLAKSFSDLLSNKCIWKLTFFLFAVFKWWLSFKIITEYQTYIY